MQHAEFRRLFGANPKRNEAEVLEHRAGCAECARYAADLERVDALVAGALNAPAPPQQVPPWELDRQRRGSAVRWYALAASVVVAVALATTVWFARDRDALYAAVVEHAEGERKVMVVTEKRFDPVKAEERLSKIGTRQRRELPLSTVRVCKIRGVSIPHLIMQTPEGPVHVMVLPRERMFVRHAFEKGGYEGVIVPDQGGSIAVVGMNRAAVDHAARLSVGAFEWTP